MDTLDDIFNKEKQDYKGLKEEQSQLLRFATILWLISSMIWFIWIVFKPSNRGLLDGSSGFDINLYNDIITFFIVIPILIMLGSVIIGVPLTILMAIIPYKNFSSSERFIRMFLLISIGCFIVITLGGFYYILIDFKLINT